MKGKMRSMKMTNKKNSIMIKIVKVISPMKNKTKSTKCPFMIDIKLNSIFKSNNRF
jgi:hypothetical protein